MRRQDGTSQFLKTKRPFVYKMHLLLQCKESPLLGKQRMLESGTKTAAKSFCRKKGRGKNKSLLLPETSQQLGSHETEQQVHLLQSPSVVSSQVSTSSSLPSLTLTSRLLAGRVHVRPNLGTCSDLCPVSSAPGPHQFGLNTVPADHVMCGPGV